MNDEMGTSSTKHHNERNHSFRKSKNRMNYQEDRKKEIGHKMSVSEYQHGMVIEQPNDNDYDTEDDPSQQQIQHDQSATQEEDNKGEKWHHRLTESLNQHCKLLSGLDAALVAQRGTIDFLLQYITENTERNDGDTTTRAESPKMRLVEGAVDILVNIKTSCESMSKPLKDSFKALHKDIDNSLEQFGKRPIVIDKQQERKFSEKAQKEVEISNDVRKLKDEVKQLKQDESEKNGKIEELQTRNRKLTRELEQYRPQKVPATTRTIQLFYLHEGKAIKDIEKELKSMLINKLRNTRFRTCKRSSEIDPNKLVIVLYIVASRVGADAANAIKDIKNPGNTILMLIHYQDVHSLSSERSSDVLNDQKFRNLRGILDLAFMTDSGFFHCEMNESSIDELCALCRQRSDDGDRF